MLRRLRGECSQDVWRPIDFRIANRFRITVPAISSAEPSAPYPTSITVAWIGVWHALKCGPKNPSLVD